MEGSGSSCILECVWVKAEPSLSSGARGRHAGHERDHDEAIEPAAHTYIDVFVKQEVLSVKQEAQSEEEDECASQETLNTGHRVKSELVPEEPQLPGAAVTPCVRVKEECEGGEEGRGDLPPARTQLGNIKVTAGDNYVCLVCRETFALKSHLTEHMVAHDRTARRGKPQADSGGALQPFARALSAPAPAPAPPPPNKNTLHPCDICHKQFKKLSYVDIHKRIHTGERPYACATCNKQFAQASTLRTHVLTHMAEKPHACEICQKQFTLRCSWSKHMKMHMAGPHTCETCKEQFQTYEDYKSHRRVHTGDTKLHPCDKCEKRFRSSSNLKIHQLFHANIKPYACEVCGMAFTIKTSLYNHKRVHTGERPYSCEVCRRSYKDVSSLRRHQLSHTGERRYGCDLCGKRFVDRCCLVKHIKRHMKRGLC